MQTQFVLITPAAALVILLLMLPLAVLRWYWPERALDWLLGAFALSAGMHWLAPHANDLPWQGSNLAAMLLPPLFVACFCASAVHLLPAPAKLVSRLPWALAASLLVWFVCSFFQWGNAGVAGRGLAVTAAFLLTAGLAVYYSRLERAVGLELLALGMAAYPLTSALLVYTQPGEDWRVALITAPYILVGAAAMAISTIRAVRDMRAFEAKVMTLELTAPVALSAEAARAHGLKKRLSELAQPTRTMDVALDKVVQAAIRELHAEPGNRAVDIRVGPLPPVHGEPRRLQQLFYHLMRNAVEHSRGVADAFVAVGMLEDRASDRDQLHGLFFVQDQGAGFDPADAERLFTPYGEFTSDGGQGTAYGIAIAQHIVEGMGGRLWAESEPGQGATFLFTLPKAAPA